MFTAKTRQKFIKSSFAVVILALFFTLAAPALAQETDTYCSGTSKSLIGCIKYRLGQSGGAEGAGLPETGEGDLPAIVGKVIKAALMFVGTIFLVMIIYAGFMWMTAGGNTEQTKKAASMMRNAVIGLLIIFVSYALTLFVFDVLMNSANSV